MKRKIMVVTAAYGYDRCMQLAGKLPCCLLLLKPELTALKSAAKC